MSTDSQMMRDAVAEAVEQAFPKALQSAARDPDTWAALQEGMKKHVSARAGGLIMNAVWSVVSRIMLFIMLGLLIYAIGGWALVAKIFGVFRE